MKSPIFQLAAAMGICLSCLPVSADDCDCAGQRATNRYYSTETRSSDIRTRTYVRTTPVYTDLRLSPVSSYRTVLQRPAVSRYRVVEQPAVSRYRLVEVPDERSADLRLEENERLTGGGDVALDCGTDTRSLSSVLLGLTSALEAAKKIKDLLEPDPPDAPPAEVDEDELIKRLQPKIKEIVKETLEEEGYKPRQSPEDSDGENSDTGFDENERLPALRRKIVDESPAIKELKRELATAKKEREQIFEILKKIDKRLPAE